MAYLDFSKASFRKKRFNMFGVSRVGWHWSVHAYSTTEWLPRAATGSVVLPILVWLSATHHSSARTHTHTHTQIPLQTTGCLGNLKNLPF